MALLCLCATFLGAPLAEAQSTTAVTGTILDPNGIPYAGATVTAALSNPSSGTGYTIPGGAAYTGVILVSGAANSAGTFNMQLVQNGQLTPGSSTWSFTVCQTPGVTIPLGTGSQCFTVSGITITGASQDISANLNAAALPLTQKANLSRVYNTLPAAGNTAITATTMATAPAIPALGTSYRFTVYASETVVGTSCAGNSVVTAILTWTDPNEAAPANNQIVTYTITTNGALGRLVPVLTNPFLQIRAKAGTVVQFSTTYAPGGSCAPAPIVQLYPVLEQL